LSCYNDEKSLIWGHIRTSTTRTSPGD